MSDRYYLRLTFREPDLPKFVQLLGAQPDDLEAFAGGPSAPADMVEATWRESAHGRDVDGLATLGRSGVPFDGFYSADSVEVSDGLIASYGGEYIDCCTIDGDNPAVSVLFEGNLDENEETAARTYWRLFRLFHGYDSEKQAGDEVRP